MLRMASSALRTRYMSSSITKAAPFMLKLDAPLDLKRGTNDLDATVKNVTDKPLTLTARLRLWRPKGQQDCGKRTVTLVPGATERLRFGVGRAVFQRSCF